MKLYTLTEYQNMLFACTCKWCEDKVSLDKQPVQHYDHEYGWEVTGFHVKQWLYVICPKCGYQWALWKLGIHKPEK